MMNNLTKETPATNLYARKSLVSITLAGIITTLHHAHGQGPGMLVPGAVIVVLPSLLMLWFRRSGNKGALWAYGLLGAFIIAAFGFVDGFLDHTLLFVKTLAFNVLLPLHGGDPKVVEKVFSLVPPAPVDAFYQSTGILTFVLSLYALYYGYKFIQGTMNNDTLK